MNLTAHVNGSLKIINLISVICTLLYIGFNCYKAIKLKQFAEIYKEYIKDLHKNLQTDEI